MGRLESFKYFILNIWRSRARWLYASMRPGDVCISCCCHDSLNSSPHNTKLINKSFSISFLIVFIWINLFNSRLFSRQIIFRLINLVRICHDTLSEFWLPINILRQIVLLSILFSHSQCFFRIFFYNNPYNFFYYSITLKLSCHPFL